MIGYGKRVLLVFDPETIPLSLASILEEEGFLVVQVRDAVQALCAMRRRRFDAVITDYTLAEFTGLDLLRQSHLAWPDIPVLFFADENWEISDRAAGLGGFAWIRKSSDPGILLSLLALATEQATEQESMRIVEEVWA